MQPQNDLFGEPVDERSLPLAVASGKRKPTKPNGYAAPPGTGPDGRTCADCQHYCIKRMGNTYRKCGLMRANWTGGPGTDIKARAPACRNFLDGNAKASSLVALKRDIEAG